MSVDATIDVHWASEEEKIVAYRNVHEFWSGGRTLDEHLAWRAASPQHQRARWCVGCLEGRVVSSLGCYPMQYRLDGEVLDGFAIGAVHTMPEARGRGFAPRLFAFVEQQQHAAGAALSLLYSDINPDYYARLGYVRCPSYELRVEFGEHRDFTHDVTLVPAEPDDLFRQQYEQAYERSHQRFAFSVHRERDYWDYLWRKDVEDSFYQVEHAKVVVGYLRVGGERQRVLRDIIIADERLDDVLMAALDLAGASAELLTSWVPQHALRGSSIVVERTREITMVKPLDERLFGDGAIDDAQHLRELDHV